MNHIPLSTLLNAFPAAGLAIRDAAELDAAPMPASLTMRATKA